MLAAGAAVAVVIVGVLIAGGDNGDSDAVAVTSTVSPLAPAATPSPSDLSQDDSASSASGGATTTSEPAASAAAIVPMDARFRRPITVLASADAVPADFEHAEVADDGGPPTRLESVDDLTTSDRLSFLISSCALYPDDDPCSRGYWFVDPDGEPPAERWAANRPFHIRHGFVNETSEPLGPGFDLAIYIFSEVDEPNEPHSFGPTKRYTTDYIVRGESDACGPNHATQDGPVTCEWFVHDFPDGLPAGRWVIWGVWEAPCTAWEDLGMTECTDLDEVMSLFSSGASGPWT